MYWWEFLPIGGELAVLRQGHLVDVLPAIAAGRGDQPVEVAPADGLAADASPDAGLRRSRPDRIATVETAFCNSGTVGDRSSKAARVKFGSAVMIAAATISPCASSLASLSMPSSRNSGRIR